MPSSVAAIFEAAGLERQGAVRWGSPVPELSSGVYVVSLSADPVDLTPVLSRCPVDHSAVERLLDVRPGLLLDGHRPTPEELVERVSAFWFPEIAKAEVDGLSLADGLDPVVRGLKLLPA